MYWTTESRYNANFASLLGAEGPLVPYPSIVLRPSRMYPSGTDDGPLRGTTFQTWISHLGLQPVLPIKLLSMWMEDHIVRRCLASHISAPVDVEAPRSPILEIGVCEDSRVDHAFSHLILVSLHVGKWEKYRWLIEGVSVLPKWFLQCVPDLQVVYIDILNEAIQRRNNDWIHGWHARKRQDKVENITVAWCIRTLHLDICWKILLTLSPGASTAWHFQAVFRLIHKNIQRARVCMAQHLSPCW